MVCHSCGEVEIHGRGVRYCDGCRDEVYRLSANRASRAYKARQRENGVAPLLLTECVLQLAHKAIIDCDGPAVEDCATCKVANLCPRVARLEVAVS